MTFPAYQCCRMCKKRYGADNQAKLLPCGHCLCDQCTVKTNSQKICPEPGCGMSFRLSPTFTVYKLSDYSDPSSEVLSNADTYRSCICAEDFDEGDHAPLLIPECGHTFCRTCLTDFAARSSPCPMCQKKWSFQVNKLKIVKDLVLPSANIARRSMPSVSNGRSTNIQRRPATQDHYEPKKKMNIYVKNMAKGGKSIMFEMSPTDTVQQLKMELQRMWRISPTEQSLLFGHNYLQVPTRTLTQCGIINGSEIILTCRQVGG